MLVQANAATRPKAAKIRPVLRRREEDWLIARHPFESNTRHIERNIARQMLHDCDRFFSSMKGYRPRN
jgi:hypothetical protein